MKQVYITLGQAKIINHCGKFSTRFYSDVL